MGKLYVTRKDIGLNQREFAAKVGYTAGYLCDLEKGRRDASVAFINALCDALDCNPDQRRKWHIAGATSHGWELY